jgi:hypothetical protein
VSLPKTNARHHAGRWKRNAALKLWATPRLAVRAYIGCDDASVLTTSAAIDQGINETHVVIIKAGIAVSIFVADYFVVRPMVPIAVTLLLPRAAGCLVLCGATAVQRTTA